ncbi:hypothetical protein ASC94_23040 [Massilia sp. Root418]|jgi:hypothetical protein|uniref:hypothetical protein n=1 Tax=Massilia sp. Root418 TaxID=1736532 RepID=UPI0006FB1DCE|nr:hypothetical protein [Massilia sp. Root418]KQW89307.1 hypothetical protein ASC94_23040 [Massilia sp. Root418]
MRKLILGGAAAATLLAAWFAPDDEGMIVSPAAATPRPAYDATGMAHSAAIAAQIAAAKAAPGIAPSIAAAAAAGPSAEPAFAPGSAPAIPAELQIQRRVANEDQGNLFSSTGWQAPSPLKPAAARAPQEQLAGTGGARSAGGAPPLPFQFVGRFIDDGKVAYFLQMEDHNIVARVGEKVGDHYQLEGAANGALTFTYLPLNLKQTLAVGDLN